MIKVYLSHTYFYIPLLMLIACSSSPPPIMPKQHVLTPFGTHDTLTHHDWQKEALTVEHAVTISLQHSPKVQQILAEFDSDSVKNQQLSVGLSYNSVLLAWRVVMVVN